MIPLLFVLGISLGISGIIFALIEYYGGEHDKLDVTKKGTFQIVLSEGMYDIRFNDRRLTSKPTLDEAKQWLECNRSNYLKEDSLIYEKSYEKATKIS